MVIFGVRYSFGVFFTPLEAEFGWPRATTSGIFAVYMVAASAFAVIGGWALDRYGPRIVVTAMALVTGIGLLLTSRVDALWQLYLTYSLMLAVGTGPTYAIVMSTGTRWFSRRRATALAIIGSGAGLGTVVMAPVSAQIIAAYDWRASFTALAIIVVALVVPAAWLLRKEPAAKPVPGIAGADPEPKNSTLEHFSLREALRTRSFWSFFFIWLSYSFCLHLVITHVVPRAEDAGISPVQAASILSVMAAVTVPSRVLIGVVSDRVGRRGIGVICALLHTAAMLWLIGSTETWMFYVFAVVYGVGYGGIDPPIVSLIGDHFGLRRVGVIMGSLIVGWGLGAAAGPYIAGLIFDASGSYSAAFAAAAAVMVVAAALIWALKPPEKAKGRV
jgi:MFS family permease